VVAKDLLHENYAVSCEENNQSPARAHCASGIFDVDVGDAVT
jgi:hypothetical protein